MPRILLQPMLDAIRMDDLPVNWHSFDFASFSKTKTLWDYQQRAVENAVKVLWKYYQKFADYSPTEPADTNRARRQQFFQWYRDNHLADDLDIPLNTARNGARLLTEYFATTPAGAISYEQFINRACFWMATGSGKTLVLVKLVQVLWELAQRGEIPRHDILVLTHRDDLIEQLRRHVDEFNRAHSDLFVHLRELRDYASAKWENPSLFRDRELTVFYYRSDNLSNEQKEKIVDYRQYDDDGKWYVLLDEAHKGDKEDSKRQHIYAILARNGFLFNFSATFTDARDVVTTASDFNLARFIDAGYGKHIAVLKQEIRAFRDKEDYTNQEKQKIVLKSLLMLTYARKFHNSLSDVTLSKAKGLGAPTNNRILRSAQNDVKRVSLYHKPLLLTLVNSVNTQDADLKLFFRELERIGKDEIRASVFDAAKEELWEELSARPAFLFEKGVQVEIDKRIFNALSQKDILQSVYNASTTGKIEIYVRPSNKQELAFKLVTSDQPFALVKIGDIAQWLKDELAGYEVNERFEDESYFADSNGFCGHASNRPWKR